MNVNTLRDVFSKLTSMLKRLQASSIPPLVFQLLHFVKQNSELSKELLKTLNELFASKISPEEREGGSSNVDLDSIEIVSNESGTVEELMQAECMVIYHINQAAKNNHIIGREVVNIIKAASLAPELVLSPFSLFLSLSFIANKQHREPCLAGVKVAMVKAAAIEEARKNFIWTRSVMTKLPDVGDLLSMIITQAKKHGGWDLIVEGILELGLALLDCNTIVKSEMRRIKSVNTIGAKLLSKLIKKQPGSQDKPMLTISPVMSPLTNKIITSNAAAVQFSDALRIIIADNFMKFQKGVPNFIAELIETFPKLAFNTARRCLYAMLPIVKLNKDLRNSLIMILRKLFFSSSVTGRQTATAGVLMMLKTFRISTSRNVSQLSQSTGSLSQVMVDTQRGASTTNEALCLELLGVLRRCFSQQCEVKMVFYTGIVEVINKNPEMVEGILELGYSHLLTLWGPEGSSRQRWQLNLDNIIKDVNGTWTVEEPVGWFLHFLQLAVTRCQQVSDERIDVLDNIVRFLDELVTKYANCEPGELGFGEADNFDRKTRDGEKNLLKIDQLKCLLESLMEYLFTHGAEREVTKNDQFLSLFTVYTSLDKVVQGSLQRLKAKKGDKGKKKDKDKDNNSTQDTSIDSGIKVASFIPPLNCFSLKCLSLMLKAFFLDSTPSHQEALERLRGNSELVISVLDATSLKLTEVSNNLAVNGDEGAMSDSDFRYLQSILHTLFNHSITSSRLCPADVKKSSSMLLQCLQIMFTYFPRRKLQVVSALFEESPTRRDEDTDLLLVEALRKVDRRATKYIGLLDDPDEHDVPQKAALVLEIFKALLAEIVDEANLKEPRHLAIQMNNNAQTTDIIVMKPLQTLVFFTILKSKMRCDYGLDMAKKMHFLTGDLNTTVRVEQTDKCPGMDDNNKYLILPILFSYLDEQFNQAEMVLNWLRSTSEFIDSAQQVIKVETELCFLLAKQVNALSELVKTSVPTGAADVVFKLLSRHYSISRTLTKYLITRVKRAKDKSILTTIRFESLIGLTNKQLTKHVHSFITYVDKERSDKEIGDARKRAAKNTVLAPEVAKKRVLKDSALTTNLVLKMEQLDADLIKLEGVAGKKKEERLVDNFKSSNRDFKMHRDKLYPESGDDDDEEEEEEEEEEENEGGMGSPLLQSTAMNDITNSEPPRKKSRTSLLGSPVN